MPREPQEYVGVYYNAVGTIHIDVTFDGEQLQISFPGLEDEVWALQHWEGDTFTWLPESRQILIPSPDYYKIKFVVSNLRSVEQLTWVHEGWNIPDGEDFFKVDSPKQDRAEQRPL